MTIFADMITLDDIRKPVTAELEALDEFVDRQFTAEGELLSDMLRYALSARGKGIRPMLVMLSAAMNAPVKGAAAGRRACLAAMLVEMIHVASLIHDDVIDEADMRRGKPSANARWQSHKAVILGDYILAKNMNIGLQSGQFDLVTHVCGSMAALCEGEVLQDECAANSTMTRQAYLDIIYKKTASLLGVSASAGALAVGATRDRVATMRRFGEAVGMAFQIQDDILDYTPTAHTGKPANNDLREGKITLPLLSVLDRASDSRRRELLERLSRCHESDEEVEYLRSTVENEGGLSFAAEVMQGYIARAVEMLSDYPDSEYRSALASAPTSPNGTDDPPPKLINLNIDRFYGTKEKLHLAHRHDVLALCNDLLRDGTFESAGRHREESVRRGELDVPAGQLRQLHRLCRDGHSGGHDAQAHRL